MRPPSRERFRLRSEASVGSVFAKPTTRQASRRTRALLETSEPSPANRLLRLVHWTQPRPGTWEKAVRASACAQKLPPEGAGGRPDLFFARARLVLSYRHRVKKYWHVINIGIQNNLAYRVNFLFRVLFGFIPLLATIYLWRAVYRGNPAGSSIGAFTLAQMTSYYLIVTIADSLTAVTDDDWLIAADIKDGNISQFLVKPINYLAFRLCLFCSGRLIYFLVAALPLAVFIFCLRGYFMLPPDAATLAWFFVALIMTALLQFFISYAMAMLAFWVLEVSTFIFILFAFEIIASGHLFPLSILPPALERLLLLHAVPVPDVFSGEHLHGPSDGRGAGAGPAGAGRLGGVHVADRLLRLAPGPQEIRRRRRMTFHEP